MTNIKKKPGSVLGRGLGNLLSVDPEPEKEEQGITEIKIDQIKTNVQNPRKKFDKTSIEELSQTIKEHGLLQPILVLKEKDHYVVVSGERRLRACRLLNFEKVPCVIKELSERQSLEVSLIENIQREQLDAIEEANVYKTLLDEYSLTQEELSGRVGKNRATIANRVRLLRLPWEIQTAMADGRLTEGQIRPLLSIKNKTQLEEMATFVLSKGLSARQVEELVRNQKDMRPGGSMNRKGSKKISPDPNITSLQESLQESLGLRVSIRHNAQSGRGKVILDYFSLDDLDRIIAQIKNVKENSSYGR